MVGSFELAGGLSQQPLTAQAGHNLPANTKKFSIGIKEHVAMAFFTKPLGNNDFFPFFHLHAVMQCMAIGGAIRVQVIPDDRLTLLRIEGVVDIREISPSPLRNIIEIDSKCPGTLPHLAGELLVDIHIWRKIIVMRLELLPNRVMLCLNRL